MRQSTLGRRAYRTRWNVANVYMVAVSGPMISSSPGQANTVTANSLSKLSTGRDSARIFQDRDPKPTNSFHKCEEIVKSLSKSSVAHASGSEDVVKDLTRRSKDERTYSGTWPRDDSPDFEV